MHLAARVATAAALRSAVRPAPVATGARPAPPTGGGAHAPDPPGARPGQGGAGRIACGAVTRSNALTHCHLIAPLDAAHRMVRQASRGATSNPSIRVSRADDGPVPLSGATLALLARRATEESP